MIGGELGLRAFDLCFERRRDHVLVRLNAIRILAGTLRDKRVLLMVLAFALVAGILFEHVLAEVADSDHALEAEALALDDVSCTATTEDLSAYAAMMLATKGGKDGQALATLFGILVGHPKLATEPLAPHAPKDCVLACLQADLCGRAR